LKAVAVAAAVVVAVERVATPVDQAPLELH
jgi:hypothetical protein